MRNTLVLIALAITNASEIYVSHGENGGGSLVDGNSGVVIYNDSDGSSSRTPDEAAHDAAGFHYDDNKDETTKKENEDQDGEDLGGDEGNEISFDDDDDDDDDDFVYDEDAGAIVGQPVNSADDESQRPGGFTILSAVAVPSFVIFLTFYMMAKFKKREADRRGQPSLRDATSRNLYELESLPSHSYVSTRQSYSPIGTSISPQGCRNIV